MDFMADQLFDGRAFRILTVVDCHTRESLATVPRVSFRAYQVAEALDEIARSRGRPKSLRVDNVLCGEAAGALDQQISARR
jgi:putative transposase